MSLEKKTKKKIVYFMFTRRRKPSTPAATGPEDIPGLTRHSER